MKNFVYNERQQLIDEVVEVLKSRFKDHDKKMSGWTATDMEMSQSWFIEKGAKQEDYDLITLLNTLKED